MISAEEAVRLGVAERTIEIRPLLARSRYLQALVYGDFAVHPCVGIPDVWQITQLPLGTCLAIDWCGFDDPYSAIAAMKEMQALRNDWAVITGNQMTRALEAQLKEIALRHGAPPDRHRVTATGKCWDVGASTPIDRGRFGKYCPNRPNGYGPVPAEG